jgi:hypothetical protein
MAGILAGFFIFVPAAHVYRYWLDSTPLRQGRDYLAVNEPVLDGDLQLLARFARDYQWLRGLSPAAPLRRSLTARLVAASDTRFSAYRTQAASPLEAFDWNRVCACLQRALLLTPSDAAIRGRLELAETYRDLVAGRGEAAELQRKLTVAASLLPTWPDPHLALARLHIYRQKNVGVAVAEWHTAEKLGFQSGPREWEQEGDGYLARVESTFGEFRTAAAANHQRRLYGFLQRDAIRARQRYEPIAGFGHVNRSLARLETIESAAAALDAQRARHVPKPRRYSRTRSWR